MINQIKNRLKKILLCIASFMMLVSGLTTSVSALTGVTNSIRYKDWILIDPTDGSEHGTEGYLMVDNTPVFCVDYYEDFRRGVTVTAGTYKDIGISEEKAKRLSLIAYYGTKVAGRTDRDWYAITQGLIWREIHERNDLEWVRTNTAYTYAEVQQKWNEILADVNRYYTSPSFVNNTQSVDADRSLTLTDTNGVLKDMIVASNGGLNVNIKDNQLIIEGSTSVNEANIVLRKNIPASETGTSIFYTSDNCQSVATFKISDPMQVAFKVQVNQFGKLELTKYNDDKSGTVEETSYRITGPDGFDETHTTDKNGKIILERLVPGKYKAVETKAGNGYIIDTTEFGFTITANETTAVDPTNIEPKGKIELTKSIDASKTNGLTGDAVLDGNSYALYAKEDITNKAGTKTFYKKDMLVSTKTTDADGKVTWDDLPLGNYYIRETKSNDSLVLNTSVINVSIEYQGQTVKKVIEKTETSNRVNMQKIQVFKSGEKEGISGFVKGLQGAEFTYKLKSEVNHVGWDSAKTYAVITTDSDGRAVTPYLPYGTYLVKETKTPANYITAPDFTVSVTDDYSEYKDVDQIKIININNRPFTSQVKLVKVDKETGKTVTLNSANFKIKDSDGNYVTQKVAGQKIDTFTTNSKNQITALFGKKGEVTLPLELDAGTYTIEEIKTPDGFLELNEVVTFTITNQYDYDIDEDDDPILTVKIENDRPEGKIILKKTFEDAKDTQNLSAKFKLTALDNIIDPVDGTVLYKKGQVITKDDKDGIYMTDAEGMIVIEHLPLSTSGAKYQLEEVEVPYGYGFIEEPLVFDIDIKDTKTKIYEITAEAENKLIDLKTTATASNGTHEQQVQKEVTITDVVEYDELTPGKEYTVKGTLMDKATGEPLVVDDHNITAEKTFVPEERKGTVELEFTFDASLLAGTTTVVFEDLYLDGKEIATHSDIDDKDQTIKIIDIHTTAKIDDAKKVVINNSENGEQDITLTDTVTYTNLTVGKEYTIKGVLMDKVTGKEYGMQESVLTFVPETADGTVDMTFTFNASALKTEHPVVVFETLYDDQDNEIAEHKDIDDEDQTVEVFKYDDVEISKQDITSKQELPGASLEIRDEKGNVIEQWVSSNEPHTIKGLEVEKTYTLTETTAPNGYKTAETITFTVEDNGIVVQQVVMYDEHIPTVVKTGDETDILSTVLILLGSGLLVVAISYRIKRKKDE